MDSQAIVRDRRGSHVPCPRLRTRWRLECSGQKVIHHLIDPFLLLPTTTPLNSSLGGGPTSTPRWVRGPSTRVHVPGTPQVPASALRNEGAGQRGRRSRSSKTLKPCCKLESRTKYVRSTTKAGFWNSLHCLRLRCPCGRHGEHSSSHVISLLASRLGR